MFEGNVNEESSHEECLDSDTKLEIKQESSTEYFDVPDYLVTRHLKKEMEPENEEVLHYETIVCKNEELYLKPEYGENPGLEQIQTPAEEHSETSSAFHPYADLSTVTVDGMKLFECDVCEYKSKRKGNLKVHKLKHKNNNEIKMFECDICEYKTLLKGSFKKHLVIHKNVDEVEMFPCDICPYQSRLKGNLTKHLLTHKGEAFKCDGSSYKKQRYISTKNATKKDDVIPKNNISENITLKPLNSTGYMKVYLDFINADYFAKK